MILVIICVLILVLVYKLCLNESEKFDYRSTLVLNAHGY